MKSGILYSSTINYLFNEVTSFSISQVTILQFFFGFFFACYQQSYAYTTLDNILNTGKNKQLNNMNDFVTFNTKILGIFAIEH